MLYEHAPWISYYVRMLPWAGRDLKLMRKMGFARAEQRYTQGSSAKDLFYYLVRYSNLLAASVSESHGVDVSE